MSQEGKTIAVFAILLGTIALTAAAFGQEKELRRPLPAGAVYVMTNQVTNEIAIFRRNVNGTLTSAGSVATGGAGNPVAQPGDPPTDPLASQGALIMDRENQLLFAVNAGSNQISVLKVTRDGLTMVDLVNSGGVRPISLTLYGNFLYVLNEGTPPPSTGDGNSQNITGFTVGDDGTLTPLKGSTQPLIGGAGADPAQVGFNSDGTLLTVTEKMGNRLDTYTVDANGVASPPIANASSGLTPFGFAFNDSDTLVVSEAFGGVPSASAVSSYDPAADGTLKVISGSVPNSQTAACWVVIRNNGTLAFVSNTASGTISSYGIGDDGSLTLVDAVAASMGPNSALRDMALNNNSRFLYVQGDGGQTVFSYRVEQNGDLTLIDTDNGLPFGAQGIAAK